MKEDMFEERNMSLQGRYRCKDHDQVHIKNGALVPVVPCSVRPQGDDSKRAVGVGG